ncbi:hypothetical protein [Pseudomonas sp.]|uniref:hypothetical protein n=1 Tax=Pseudomonas sp. TaxID=306 RepID=UPI0031E449BC
MSKVFDASAITVTVTGATIATGAASASAGIPKASSGEYPRYIRIAATAAAYVRIGKGAQTAIATDLLVQPGDAVVLAVASGLDTVAAIQVTAAGVVQISPLENM